MSINDFNKPTRFTGESYGKKISVELDHSDLDMNELFEAFKTIALGLGFSEETWNECVKETAYDIETDERIDEWNAEDSENEYDVEDSFGLNDGEEPQFDWDDIDSPSEWEEDVYPPNDTLKEAAEDYKKKIEDKE